MAAREGFAAAIGAAAPFPSGADPAGHQVHTSGVQQGASRRSSSRVTRNAGVEAAGAENRVGSELLVAVVAAAAASYNAQEDAEAPDAGDSDANGDEDYVPRATTAAVVPAPAVLRIGKMPLVTRLDALVQVLEMEQRVFDTWEHFHAYLQAYGQNTFQLYSVRSATPSARRNNLVSKKKVPQLQKLIPEQFVHYVKTITCTHGGKPRPRSTGVRPNHQHRAMECPAQINACVKKDPDGVWRVHVTNQHAWHNHELSDAIYNGYPEVRNALSAEVLATVNILRKAEAKRKKILEYIVENTPNKPKMKDVHNLLSKLKQKDAVALV